MRVRSVHLPGATKFLMSWYVADGQEDGALLLCTCHVVRQEVKLEALAIRRPRILAGVELSHLAVVVCFCHCRQFVVTCSRVKSMIILLVTTNTKCTHI